MHVPLVNGSADLDRNVIDVDGRTLKLSPNESRLFRYLVERAGQTVEQPELLREVFGYNERVQSRTVITTMQRLRKKVERDPAEPVHLVSVYGRGYRFEPIGESDGLLGRAEPLAELRSALEAGRVWVVAPGGFGKTALVTHYAASAGPDAVVVDLTSVATEEELISSMCRALGIATIEKSEALAAALAHRAPDLVVLDAAEDFGTALAPFVQDWSDVAPVVVTSRAPCPGEPTLQLGPLAPADAERLFARCLSRPVDADRLTALLERLEGVPLALELAGAQLAVFAPEDLDPHLDDLGSVLVGGQGRQSSMDGVLDWSWQRTEAAPRAALVALAPARGGLAVADAGLLIGAGGLAMIGELQRWGWIRVIDGRVRMLDPIRQFVERNGSGSGLQQASAAHRQLFLDRTRAHEEDLLVGRGREFLDVEAGNLRAALRSGWAARDTTSVELALLLVPTMGQRVPMVEALRWLDEAETIATDGLLGDVRVLRAALWMSRASVDAAEQDLRAADAGGVRDEGLLALRWGRFHQDRMQLEDSARHLEIAVAALDGPWKLQAQLVLAYTLLRSGQDDEALRLLRLVLARSRVQNAPGKTLLALGTLGVLYTGRDDFDAAQQALDEALRIAEEVGDELVSGKVHTQLGGLALYQGRTDAAEHHWSAALEVSVRLGSSVGAAMAEVNLAGLHLVTRQLNRAEELLLSARGTFQEAGVVPGAAYASLGLGRVASLRREWETAEGWFDRADGKLPPPLAWFVGVERCIARAEQGDLDGARAALDAGAAPTDAGSRAGRAIAEAYCHALQLDADAEVHAAAIDAAIAQAREVPDPVIGDLADRLEAFVARVR